MCLLVHHMLNIWPQIVIATKTNQAFYEGLGERFVHNNVRIGFTSRALRYYQSRNGFFKILVGSDSFQTLLWWTSTSDQKLRCLCERLGMLCSVLVMDIIRPQKGPPPSFPVHTDPHTRTHTHMIQYCVGNNCLHTNNMLLQIRYTKYSQRPLLL